jgi:hypothetical protein
VIAMETTAVSASVDINLEPAALEPASPPRTLFGVAESMMPGVKVLAKASPPCSSALALLAAHVLECLLKAYLSRNGSGASLKNPDVRHNLNRLWTMAFAQGLQITGPPNWADRLSGVHNNGQRLAADAAVRKA